VTLGLCSQIELDALISKAASKRAATTAEKEARLQGPTLRKVVTVVPQAADTPAGDDADGEAPRREVTAEEVFANFGRSAPAEEE